LNAAFGDKLGLENQHIDGGAGLFIAHTLRGEGFDASEDGTGRGIPLVPVLQPVPFDTTQITSKANRSKPKPGDPGHPLAAGAHAPAIAFPARMSGTQFASTEELSPALSALNPTAIAFSCKDHGADSADDLAPPLRAMGHGESHANAGGQVAVAFAIQERAVSENPDAGPDGIGVAEEVAYTLEARSTPQAVGAGWAVRRLTPAECARLQGFPDHHARIAWRGKAAEICPDGPQYKTYGNSMAVNVMRWLGERLQANMAESRR
jgi:DNA (cytosine-5)-methyltransferase 1